MNDILMLARQDEARENTLEYLKLGLSIAKSIIGKHHRKICVDSAGGDIFQAMLSIVKKI